MKTAGLPLPVRKAHGSFIELEDGREIIDCISSWWVTIHGHGNKQIADAIYDQALKLEHVIFAGFTHEPAQELTEQLLSRLPQHFNRVFFSDNGSTSIEVALKMAFQYWRNIGQPSRSRFIGFEGGYHGDTVGAMSAGGSSEFWAQFRPLMFGIDTVPYPASYENDSAREENETTALKAIESLLQRNEAQYAGIIIEPLVQGAAGMKMCSTEFLRKLDRLVHEHGTLLIFDEVMTGFGRTGDWFACGKAQVKPDIICLSKGITGGFLPLAVTICTESIYQAFYADELEKALFHSHSYTGNPITCAAGVASMKLLGETAGTFGSMENQHRAFFHQYLAELGFVVRARFCGTIFAFDIDVPGSASYFSDIGPRLRNRFLESGLLIRPLGKTIYLMPPYCTDVQTLERMFKTMRDVLTQALPEQHSVVN